MGILVGMTGGSLGCGRHRTDALKYQAPSPHEAPQAKNLSSKSADGKEMRVRNAGKLRAGRILAGVTMIVVVASLAVSPSTAGAIEVGDRAPDFTLPSTNGVDISLTDFKGKRWVFLEFYAAAYVPT
jgi:AhpC/TSA family protein